MSETIWCSNCNAYYLKRDEKCPYCEITRLTTELEQARIEIANRTFLERDASKRAESAEQQVVALVEMAETVFQLTDKASKIGDWLAWNKAVSDFRSAVPDRAKKIQAVMEAADRLEICIGDMAAIEEGEEHFTWDEIQKTEQAYADAVEKFGEAVRARWNDKTSRDLES